MGAKKLSIKIVKECYNEEGTESEFLQNFFNSWKTKVPLPSVRK
jgi:hypothetical protein